jgi:sentrin-specific protease 1
MWVYIVSPTGFSPKPPEPFTPTLEQRRRVNRLKDEELNARFRPKLPVSLSPEDEAKVNALLRKQGIIAKVAREQVTDQDLSRLRPRQWLNDEIINFYGALILARSESCKENPGNGSGTMPLNVHYFSTFFWSKLRKEGYDKGRLAKWTKKVVYPYH